MIKKILFITLFLAAFLERVAFDMGSNFELITAVMIIATIYIDRRHAVTLVFLTIFLSDMIIGNSNIFIFTWTGFLIPAFLASKFVQNKNVFQKLTTGTLTGAASVGFFFIWTNFGVWLTTAMYSKDLAGLTLSYINALPFLRNQAVSALMFIPSGILITETISSLAIRLQKESITKKLYT